MFCRVVSIHRHWYAVVPHILFAVEHFQNSVLQCLVVSFHQPISLFAQRALLTLQSRISGTNLRMIRTGKNSFDLECFCQLLHERIPKLCAVVRHENVWYAEDQEYLHAVIGCVRMYLCIYIHIIYLYSAYLVKTLRDRVRFFVFHGSRLSKFREVIDDC